eukprot:Gb_07578 [translate_table: standard]
MLICAVFVGDWSGHGHTGFNDGPFVMGAIRGEGLMTYKQFITEVEDDISPAEAQHRYEEYKTEYIATQKNAFFEAHKDEEWLRDKYDPSRLEDVIQRDCVGGYLAKLVDCGPFLASLGLTPSPCTSA